MRTFREFLSKEVKQVCFHMSPILLLGRRVWQDSQEKEGFRVDCSNTHVRQDLWKIACVEKERKHWIQATVFHIQGNLDQRQPVQSSFGPLSLIAPSRWVHLDISMSPINCQSVKNLCGFPWRVESCEPWCRSLDLRRLWDSPVEVPREWIVGSLAVLRARDRDLELAS